MWICLLLPGIVLNALLNRSWNRELSAVLGRQFVTTNHFDVDSFLSVWCYINREAAVEHEAGEGDFDFNVYLVVHHYVAPHGSFWNHLCPACSCVMVSSTP